MTIQFIDALAKRRTQYALGKTLPRSKDEVAALIQSAVKHAPSSFNSQSSRVVTLFGAESDKLWNIAKEELRKIVPEYCELTVDPADTKYDHVQHCCTWSYL